MNFQLRLAFPRGHFNGRTPGVQSTSFRVAAGPRAVRQQAVVIEAPRSERADETFVIQPLL